MLFLGSSRLLGIVAGKIDEKEYNANVEDNLLKVVKSETVVEVYLPAEQ